jgi:hypothetical protein
VVYYGYEGGEMKPKEIYDQAKLKLDPGETKHVNHIGCPAGEDKRHRLYFTRSQKPTNTVLHYCHNCGQGGAFSIGGRFSTDILSTLPRGKKPKDNTTYISAIWHEAFDMFPLGSRREVPWVMVEWLFGKSKPHDEDIPFFPPDSIKWHPATDSIVFGLWPNGRDYSDTPVVPPAIQQRFFRKHGPKCLTTKGKEDIRARNLQGGHKKPYINMLVIVEDVVSQYRVLEACGIKGHAVYTYALCGSNMTIEEMVLLKQQIGMQQACVWLDNDNDNVLRNSDAITQRLRNLGVATKQERTKPEPKHQTDEVIVDTVLLAGEYK